MLSVQDNEKIRNAKQALAGPLKHFMPRSQVSILANNLRGEEGDGIAEIVLRVAKVIETMPKTYETDGIEFPDKIVHLHYFRGAVDSWIVEKDMGDGSGDPTQYQAFGRQRLYGPGDEGDYGYINIQELIENGVELDLYWTPKQMKECRA